MLNKRIASILVAGMVIVSMVGCQSNKASQLPNGRLPQIQQKKETKQQEKTEKDKEVEEKYCDWCEGYADHSTDEHIAQCYDCGEYKKAKDMEFNGRSFHCGCVDEEPTEELLICPNCGKKYPASEMCEDYCPECYEELFIDGDSEANSELWTCPDCGGSYTEGDMIEDTENGVWYCFSCYDEIMRYRMNGDANSDLEDWEQ